MHSLNINESFFSKQGEGPFANTPAVFLRLMGCNLLCGQNNLASFHCDAKRAWFNGKSYTNQEIINAWQKKGWLENLKTNSHLVITGGEPLLQAQKLEEFLTVLIKALNGPTPYIEMETNSTLTPSQTLISSINQFNVSPKLSNSGLEKVIRLNPETLIWHSKNPKSIFKFVIANEKDYEEALNEIILPFNIKKTKLWLMPLASTKEELEKTLPIIKKIALEKNLNFTSRLQIENSYN